MLSTWPNPSSFETFISVERAVLIYYDEKNVNNYTYWLKIILNNIIFFNTKNCKIVKNSPKQCGWYIKIMEYI